MVLRATSAKKGPRLSSRGHLATRLRRMNRRSSGSGARPVKSGKSPRSSKLCDRPRRSSGSCGRACCDRKPSRLVWPMEAVQMTEVSESQ